MRIMKNILNITGYKFIKISDKQCDDFKETIRGESGFGSSGKK